MGEAKGRRGDFIPNAKVSLNFVNQIKRRCWGEKRRFCGAGQNKPKESLKTEIKISLGMDEIGSKGVMEKVRGDKVSSLKRINQQNRPTSEKNKHTKKGKKKHKL